MERLYFRKVPYRKGHSLLNLSALSHRFLLTFAIPAMKLSDFFPGLAPAPAKNVQPALPRAVDQLFGSFLFNGQTCLYDQLPANVRARETVCVYYGKSARSLDQARSHASRIFSFGRETRGSAHRDVWKHLKGIDQANYGISGFMQTGRDRHVIEQKYVLRQQPFGTLYLIDCRGAEILDVDALSGHFGQVEPENGEGEILFSGCLPPFRIFGAGLYRAAEGVSALVEVLANPNYQAPGFLPVRRWLDCSSR